MRGPLTRAILLQRGRQVPEIYGDPALLMPLIYQPRVSIKYKYGLIPHYIHAPRVNTVPAGGTLIDIRVGSVEEVFSCIDQIAQCNIVASSSLHGLILALAYGCKVVWLRDPRAQLTGDTFKFLDFFSSIGVAATPIEWSPESPLPAHIESLAIAAEIPDCLSDGLIAALREWLTSQAIY